MKKKLMIGLSLLPLFAQSSELKTFSEIRHAFSQGSELTFVISLKKCQSDRSLGDITISTKPEAIMLIQNKKLTASNKHFTLNDPSFSGSPVIEYNKYTINMKGDAELMTTVMDARDYHPLANHKINCELGKGFLVFDKNE
ncbi:VirK family protein [Legionella fairfieldensis]|uniref:VirK family protein n=1 Tax=Legionella fairfieldensis TaxID=45064 RepID=UPI00048A5842|nr:VirK family protein [Legionella fairfieldensis]